MFSGRTGRIGNMGLATSFYNDRDADIGETLVKTLLETRQVVPDFLEQYLPEGFTADGQQGDVAKLHFDAVSSPSRIIDICQLTNLSGFRQW
jgi:ATP-dependent RNA helicase DDX3X